MASSGRPRCRCAGSDDETMRALAALAVSDPVWQVRTRALDAIASSEDPAVREAFTSALSDSGAPRPEKRAFAPRPSIPD